MNKQLLINILRNSLAVIGGCLIGGMLNMVLIQLGSHIIVPPAGADLTTEEGLKASMHLMEPKHFLFPWLAHAVHCLVGGFIATKIGISNHLRLAMIVGGITFLGGAFMVYSLPSPYWFSILDLGLAYFPMAYIGYRIAQK